MQRIRTRHPEAKAFQAFCISITWQQVTEHFKPALTSASDSSRARNAASAEERLDLKQILELRAAFRRGLGLKAEDEEDGHDDDKKILKGGD